jgi:long-chain acyl-CoA synthetase
VCWNVRAVGIADDKSGEAVKLVVVKKDPVLTEAKVREYCKANLTGYKQPKIIEFRGPTPVGKMPSCGKTPRQGKP